jgi:transcriptional regulator with XRE-family HTH domain
MLLYGPKDNYIFSHRLQTGLSQKELAVLIGIGEGASVGRYEQGLRLPDLRAGLALEIIFEEPVQAIFAGVSHVLRSDVARRAQALVEAMSDEPTTANALKLRTLARLARLEEEDLAA